jgi:hypothetical protein
LAHPPPFVRPLEGAVAGCHRDIDPPISILGKQLDRDRLRWGAGFVAQQVHVPAAGIDEAGPAV